MINCLDVSNPVQQHKYLKSVIKCSFVMTEATKIGHFFVLVVLVTLYTHFSVFAYLQLPFFSLHRNTWL